MRRTKGVITQAYREFKDVFGRDYTNSIFIEEYMTDDADIVLMGMGTVSMPARVTVRKLREQGKKVGFVRLKWLRPFPTEELRQSLSRFKAVGVIDRDYSFGSPSDGGVVFNEVRAALYPLAKRPLMQNFIAGLGGREVTIENVTQMVETLQKSVQLGKAEPETHWIGVRE
jgi:pyruvate ferredoxin oxidoreductase alpha subunit